MKKILTLALFSLSFMTLRAQHQVAVYGNLTASNGASVENVNVHILYGDTLNGGAIHNKNILTDATGFYADTLDVPSNFDSSWVYVDITDCKGISITKWGQISNIATTAIAVNFEYCSDSVPPPPDSTFTWVYVSGTLSSNNTSVSNVPVSLYATDNNGFTYQDYVLTNNQGFYADTIPVSIGVTSGYITAQITDCNSQSMADYRYFDANNTFFNIDFVYCNDTTIGPPDSLTYSNIEGYVYTVDTSGTSPEDIRVYLIRTYGVNSDTLSVAVDSIDTKLYYKFSNVYPGNYIVKAMLLPGQASSDKYLPTYYGEKLYWADATVVTRPIAGGRELDNIGLILADTLSGAGEISGKVVDANGNDYNAAQVILVDQNNMAIAARRSNNQGQYIFNNLPFGSYKLWVEMVGKQRELDLVTISAATPASGKHNFKVLSNKVVAENATGIIDNKGSVGKLIIAPNPASTHATLTLSVGQLTKATITIYAVTGAKVWQQAVELQSGSQQMEIPVSMLEKGIYIIETMTNSAKIMSR